MKTHILEKKRLWLAGAWSQILWQLWAVLLAVAVAGSLLYGASLSLVLPGWNPGASALWLALSAGLAWCVFLPLIWKLSGWDRAIAATTDCLVTMAAGEAVLTLGALFNAIVALGGGPGGFGALGAGAFNAGVVALSNVVMAAVLAGRLRRLGVPVWQSLGAWMLVLNGSGALFFALFRQLLLPPL